MSDMSDSDLALLTDVALLHVVADGRCLHCGELAGPTGRCSAERIAAERLAEAGWPHPHGWPNSAKAPAVTPAQLSRRRIATWIAHIALVVVLASGWMARALGGPGTTPRQLRRWRVGYWIVHLVLAAVLAYGWRHG